MNQPNQEDMATTREHKRLVGEIAKKIRVLREGKDMDHARLGAILGIGPDAVRKMEGGVSLSSYVKIIELAKALGTTPNEILDFPESSDRLTDREIFQGLMEGSFMQRGLPLAEAEALATLVLEVIDRPAVRSEGTSPRQNARTLALDVVQRFFEK
jgi:transcriptional regulator with XRE-family HTH domain